MNTDALSPLLDALAAADPARRLAAARALADVGEAALPALDALIIAVDDPDADVRLAAVQALGVLDPVEAEAALLWASHSEDRRVRIAAETIIHGTARQRGPRSAVLRRPSEGHGE